MKGAPLACNQLSLALCRSDLPPWWCGVGVLQLLTSMSLRPQLFTLPHSWAGPACLPAAAAPPPLPVGPSQWAKHQPHSQCTREPPGYSCLPSPGSTHSGMWLSLNLRAKWWLWTRNCVRSWDPGFALTPSAHSCLPNTCAQIPVLLKV